MIVIKELLKILLIILVKFVIMFAKHVIILQVNALLAILIYFYSKIYVFLTAHKNIV